MFKKKKNLRTSLSILLEKRWLLWRRWFFLFFDEEVAWKTNYKHHMSCISEMVLLTYLPYRILLFFSNVCFVGIEIIIPIHLNFYITNYKWMRMNEELEEKILLLCSVCSWIGMMSLLPKIPVDAWCLWKLSLLYNRQFSIQNMIIWKFWCLLATSQTSVNHRDKFKKFWWQFFIQTFCVCV